MSRPGCLNWAVEVQPSGDFGGPMCPAGHAEVECGYDLSKELNACASVLLQVVPNTRLKHLLSLWQVLAARRSMLLVQMNQVRARRLRE